MDILSLPLPVPVLQDVAGDTNCQRGDQQGAAHAEPRDADVHHPLLLGFLRLLTDQEPDAWGWGGGGGGVMVVRGESAGSWSLRDEDAWYSKPVDRDLNCE